MARATKSQNQQASEKGVETAAQPPVAPADVGEADASTQEPVIVETALVDLKAFADAAIVRDQGQIVTANPERISVLDTILGSTNAVSHQPEVRDFWVCDPVKLDGIPYGVGDVIVLDRKIHGQLLKAGVILEPWFDEE